MEAPPGFEPGMEVLQTSALPLGDGADFGVRAERLVRVFWLLSVRWPAQPNAAESPSSFALGATEDNLRGACHLEARERLAR